MGSVKDPWGVLLQPSPGSVDDQRDRSIRRVLGLASVPVLVPVLV